MLLQGGQALLKGGEAHGSEHVADDEDRERNGAQEQDHAHVAVDRPFITGCDDWTGMTNGPNSRGDVRDRNQHEAVEAEGSKGVSGFHAVGLAVPAQHHVNGQQGQQAKGVESDIRPIPRRAPFSSAPNAARPDGHEAGGKACLGTRHVKPPRPLGASEQPSGRTDEQRPESDEGRPCSGDVPVENALRGRGLKRLQRNAGRPKQSQQEGASDAGKTEHQQTLTPLHGYGCRHVPLEVGVCLMKER